MWDLQTIVRRNEEAAKGTKHKPAPVKVGELRECALHAHDLLRTATRNSAVTPSNADLAYSYDLARTFIRTYQDWDKARNGRPPLGAR